MSQDEVLKTLVSLGLTQMDAKIYVFLAKKGAQRGIDIRKTLRITKQQLYPSLRSLQKRGIVSSTLEHPARFSAISFEKVLDLFIKAKVEETQRLQRNKKEILSKWQTMDIIEPDLSKFVVIEGRNYIFSKIRQMIEETKNRISTITTVPSLVQADQFGLFKVGITHPLKSKIQFRFLTEISKHNINAVKAFMTEAVRAELDIEGRNPDLGLRLFPQLLIRDKEEAIFFITPWNNSSLVEKDDVCLWTNCKSLVQAFEAIFEELWCNSTDVYQKIIEIETGKPIPKTLVMTETETAKDYYEKLGSAKEEIILMTSSKGLIEYSKRESLIEKWKKSGINVKIMAPIVRENWKEVQKLQKIFKVKHIPENYMVTTIIDSRHLFQFKNPPARQETPDSIHNFKNTLYTNEHEYIEKMKTTLNDVWKSARAPSTVTLEAIIGSYEPSPNLFFGNAPLNKTKGIKIIDVKPPGTLTEKEVLDKIIHADKIITKDPTMEVSRMYATIGTAAINPPDYFNLPKMLIKVDKIEKQSTLGAGDSLTIFLWLKPAKSNVYNYVPVATLGDNPKAPLFRKAIFAGTPAGENVQLVGKDEFQVRVHGNTMFAGWTVPIQLYPLSYVLPPACLVIEGYGNIKTSGFTILHPSGFKSTIEENYFDAFVTFMHPSSKYSGPGTDGVFVRDYVGTYYPPSSNG